MRFLVVLLPMLLVAGTGAAMAANEADDIIIVSVKPRNPDVKPEIATLPARAEHKTATLESRTGNKKD